MKKIEKLQLLEREQRRKDRRKRKSKFWVV